MALLLRPFVEQDGEAVLTIANTSIPFDLEGNERWLRLRQQRWTRNMIPPGNKCYLVQVEHSDGAATEVFLFSGKRSEIYFANHGEGGRFDAG